MIELNSNKWGMLEHAYGKADDVPSLLRSLAELPVYENYESEPYYSLWSSLCHQGDVFSASYAAVPHIVAIAEGNVGLFPIDFVLLPICIEIGRKTDSGPEITDELKSAYFGALEKLEKLLPFVEINEDCDIRVVSAAYATLKGDVLLGKTVLELTPDVIEEFDEWCSER